MLKLNLQKEPFWLELSAGVKVKVKPLTSAIMNAAQSLTIKQIKQLKEDGAINLDDEQSRLGLSESLLVKSIGNFAIVEWQNVLTSDGSATAPVNETTVSDLLDIWFIAQDFWKQYTASLQILEAEGNASGLAVNGTSLGAQDTVKRAKKKTSHAVEANQTTAENSAHT